MGLYKAMKTKRRKLNNFFKRHPIMTFAVVVVGIPIVVTVLYNIHIIDHREIAPEAVLAYLGVSLGIGFSFVQLLQQNERRERESFNARKPFVSLEIEKKDNLFRVELSNLGKSVYSDVFLFDEYVASKLLPNKSIKLKVGDTSEDGVITASSLFGWNEDVDNQGFPKEINFYLFDVIGVQWIVSGIRSQNGSQIVYFCNVQEGEQ